MRKLLNHKLILTTFTEQELIGNHKTRDNIDKLILGFNNILKNKKLRDCILKKLKENLNLPDKLGREGMNYWKIFVLGVTPVTLNIDYDRLQNLLNNHIGVTSQ